jgi:hypothetical protein
VRRMRLLLVAGMLSVLFAFIGTIVIVWMIVDLDPRQDKDQQEDEEGDEPIQ